MNERTERSPGELPAEQTAEYEILDLAKLKLYQRMHGLGPVLGALEFRVESRTGDGRDIALPLDGSASLQTEQTPFTDSGLYRTDGKVFYLDAERMRAEFLCGGRERNFLEQDGEPVPVTEKSRPGGCEWLCLEILHMLGHSLLGHPVPGW